MGLHGTAIMPPQSTLAPILSHFHTPPKMDWLARFTALGLGLEAATRGFRVYYKAAELRLWFSDSVWGPRVQGAGGFPFVKPRAEG